MLKLKEKPFHLLVIAALLLLVLSLMPNIYTVDIHLHDTYFILTATFLTRLLVGVMLLLWLLYVLIKKLYSKALTWIHILITIACSICFTLIPYFPQYSYFAAGTPRRYYDDSGSSIYNILGNMTPAINIFLYLMIIGQVVFIINISFGFMKRARKAAVSKR